MNAAQLQIAALLPQPVAADYLEEMVGDVILANALRTYATSMWQILEGEKNVGDGCGDGYDYGSDGYGGGSGSGSGGGNGVGSGGGGGYGNGGGYGDGYDYGALFVGSGYGSV